MSKKDSIKIDVAVRPEKPCCERWDSFWVAYIRSLVEKHGPSKLPGSPNVTEELEEILDSYKRRSESWNQLSSGETYRLGVRDREIEALKARVWELEAAIVRNALKD